MTTPIKKIEIIIESLDVTKVLTPLKDLGITG
jgi:nitrogen regulatory protein PII